MKKKLLYINNFEAPYRVPFFNALAETYEMTLALSHKPAQAQGRNAAWFFNGARKYQVVYLNTTRFFGKRIGFDIKKMLPRFDLVFMDMYANPTNMYAIWCLNRRKIPFVLSVDGMLPRKDARWLFHVKRYLLNSAAKILSPGPTVDACLHRYGVAEDKICRYPFTSLLEKDIAPALPTADQKQALRRELGITEEKVLISVGRFTYQNGYGKGYDILMKASEQLPKDTGIYIIGDAPTQEFINWKRDKNLTYVHFVGFQPKEALKKWYRAADVFVLPTREDIWGLVINEAMAQGLPIITTDKCVAGLELVQEGENGFIVPVGDVAALVRAITQILAQDYRVMGEKSLEIIKDWTIEKMYAAHVRVFEEQLTNHDAN